MTHRLAYLAGFFDGEGCISIARPEGSSYFLLRCSVANTDLRPLLVLKETFGGSVKGPYQRPRAKAIFNWNIDAAKAEAFLVRILPFLIIKRERAEKGIAFRDLFKGQHVLPRGNCDQDIPRHQTKRVEVLALRRSAYEEMRRLNKRGSDGTTN